MKPRFGALGDGPDPAGGAEAFTTLLAEAGVTVERIASHSAASPEGFWYDQPCTEFVLLVQGEATLAFADGPDHRLTPGDWAILPPHCRHRVSWTAPGTLWLAVHLPEE